AGDLRVGQADAPLAERVVALVDEAAVRLDADGEQDVLDCVAVAAIARLALGEPGGRFAQLQRALRNAMLKLLGEVLQRRLARLARRDVQEGAVEAHRTTGRIETRGALGLQPAHLAGRRIADSEI